MEHYGLSLKDLDLPMLNTLQVPRWKKTQVRKLFGSSNSYFRIVAHSPNTRKVRPLTDVCNLQDETIWTWMMNSQLVLCNQPHWKWL